MSTWRLHRQTGELTVTLQKSFSVPQTVAAEEAGAEERRVGEGS